MEKILIIISILVLFNLTNCSNFSSEPEGSSSNSEPDTDGSSPEPGTHSFYNKPDENNKEIYVKTVDELMATVYSTKEGNVTVIIADGTYQLTSRLWLTGENITYKSASGNRNSVILKGNGMNGSIGYVFSVAGSDFTARDLSIGEVSLHGIQVHGELDADNVNIINVRFFNVNQQNIKGSYDKVNKPQNHTDMGLVEHCLFEYTEGIANQYYCGGIDVHHGENWLVRNNIFRNIISPDHRLSEGAIHFWTDSANVIVEGNKVINCDRGIMLGFDSTPQYGGIIRNNSIQVTNDVGIYLCRSEDVKVYNNSVFLSSSYKNAIEYRFSSTKNLIIENNLSNKSITSRDGAVATVSNNVTDAQGSWFKNANKGDLHLAYEIAPVIDQGNDLDEVTVDIDGEEREPGKYDIGADEWN